MAIRIARIMCPVDFSEFSRHALDHALAIAKWSGASVTAVHVVPPMPVLAPMADPVAYVPVVWPPEDLEKVRADLRAFVGEETGGALESIVCEGNAAGEIVRLAGTMPADLVVLGTHGRSGFERLLLGSVTEKVLRKLPCAVLTVPPRTPDAVPSGPVMFRRILCAVDFSDCSRRALEYAVALAQGTAAALTVVHVVEPLSEYAPLAMEGLVLADYDETATDTARVRLHDMVATVVPAGVTATEVVVSGKSSSAILGLVESEKSDLVVIGVHGRGAVDLAFFGSTTNQVVRRATCPVLTLRH